MSVSKTLKERGKRYGEFPEHAKLSQALQLAMCAHAGWTNLDSTKREALQMIQHKIARVLNGDPEYKDNWHDIAGYAQLAEAACRE